MRTIGLSILAAGALLGGGCGPKSTSTIGNTPATPSGKARVECPTGDAVKATAAPYFVGAGTEGASPDIGATCLAVFTDRPLWLLDGYAYGPDDMGVALITVLVDPSTKTAVWSSGVDDYSFPSGAVDRMSGPGMIAAVDFDGDGRDEVLNISGTSAQGYDTQSLSVMTITAEGLVSAGEVPFLDDNGAADVDPTELSSCSTEYKLVGGPEGSKRLELTVTASPSTTQGCLPVGKHLMAWDGKQLVEVE